MDNPRFANRRGYLEDMMKKNTEKNYVLEFNSTESFYSEREKIDVGESGGFNWMAIYVSDNIGKLYKNIQDKVTVNETEMMGKFFLITDPIENPKWKMTGETKKIGQYTLFQSYLRKRSTRSSF